MFLLKRFIVLLTISEVSFVDFIPFCKKNFSVERFMHKGHGATKLPMPRQRIRPAWPRTSGGIRKGVGIAMGRLMSLLHQFNERLQQKPFIQPMVKDWHRTIGIIVEDRQIRLGLRFQEGAGLVMLPADEPCDLLLRGNERELLLFFAGEQLGYLHAKQMIHFKGTVRDRLKLEALVRLTASGLPAAEEKSQAAS